MDEILEKNPKIKQRILQYLDLMNITRADFCRKTGISYSNIKGKSSKSEFGGEQIGVILEVFSEINPEWLLLGKGEMLRNAKVINNGSGQFVGNNNTINADLRQYYSDSPDVLRAQIEVLDERIKEKDAQIKEKDAQIKEKDAQIKEKDAQIKEKDAQIKEKDAQIKEKDAQIKEKDAQIKELHALMNEMIKKH